MSSVVDELKGDYTAFKNVYQRLENDCGSFILFNQRVQLTKKSAVLKRGNF